MLYFGFFRYLFCSISVKKIQQGLRPTRFLWLSKNSLGLFFLYAIIESILLHNSVHLRSSILIIDHKHNSILRNVNVYYPDRENIGVQNYSTFKTKPL